MLYLLFLETLLTAPDGTVNEAVQNGTDGGLRRARLMWDLGPQVAQGTEAAWAMGNGALTSLLCPNYYKSSPNM